jgi:hypothetical protein
MRERIAAGLRSHSGWAVMVTVARIGDRTRIVDKQRIELLDRGLPRQPYHEVAEQGAPAAIIAQVELSARRQASAAYRSVAGLAAVAVIAPDRQLPRARSMNGR